MSDSPSISVRRFNDAGLERARDLHSFIADKEREFPACLDDPAFDALLVDPVLSEEVDDRTGNPLTTELHTFASRLECGRHFLDLMDRMETSVDPYTDSGLWTWLQFKWRKHLGEPHKRGAMARWIFTPTNYSTYYRHWLAGPYLVYSQHRANTDSVRGVLAGPVTEPGEVAEQMLSTYAWMQSRNLMEAVCDLYLDDANDLKEGAGGKGPGSARRLSAVLNQLSLTWDVTKMPVDKLIGMLPSEFDRFSKSPEAA